MIKAMVNKAKHEGLNILFGGDMDVHILELGKCENRNGRLLKQMTGDLGLQIMNCAWKGMSGATWSMDDSEFTLDYVYVDRERIACVVETVIMDEVDVVYSYHVAVSVSIKWKVKKKVQQREKVCKYEEESG